MTGGIASLTQLVDWHRVEHGLIVDYTSHLIKYLFLRKVT